MKQFTLAVIVQLISFSLFESQAFKINPECNEIHEKYEDPSECCSYPSTLFGQSKFEACFKHMHNSTPSCEVRECLVGKAEIFDSGKIIIKNVVELFLNGFSIFVKPEKGWEAVIEDSVKTCDNLCKIKI